MRSVASNITTLADPGGPKFEPTKLLDLSPELQAAALEWLELGDTDIQRALDSPTIVTRTSFIFSPAKDCLLNESSLASRLENPQFRLHVGLEILRNMDRVDRPTACKYGGKRDRTMTLDCLILPFTSGCGDIHVLIVEGW